MINDYYLFPSILGPILFISINFLFLITFTKNDSYKLVFSILLVLLISIITGVRGDKIGIDTHSYMSLFHNLTPIEPFFYLFAYTVSLFTSEENIFLMAVNITTNLLIIFAARKLTPNYPIIIAMYLSTFIFLQMNLSMIRQGLSMAFFFYAYASLLKGQNMTFWTTGMLAMITHYSGAVFLLTYVIKRFKANKTTVYLIVFSIIVYLFFTLSEFAILLSSFHHIFSKLYSYLTWQESGWHLKHFYYLFLLLISFYFFHLKHLDITYRYIYIFTLFGFSLVVLFREDEMLADRTFYFYFFFVFLLVEKLNIFFKQKALFYFFLNLGINLWLYKSMMLQYPGWYMPPFEAVSK